MRIEMTSRADYQNLTTRAGPNWVEMLIAIIHRLKLNDVQKYSKLAQKIIRKNDQTVAKNMVKQLMKEYSKERINPNHFRTLEKKLDGGFFIGFVDEDKRFGLDTDDLVRNAFCPGQIGTGKTTLMISVYKQLAEKRIHAVYIDRKGDMDHTVREGYPCINWKEKKDNFLYPGYSGVDIYEFRNDFVKLFAERFQFLMRGHSIFLIGVDTLFKKFGVYQKWPNWNWNKDPFPTLIDLLDHFKSTAFRRMIRGQGHESLNSIIDKLQSIIIELEPIISCQRGFDIVKLLDEGRAISYNYNGLSVDYQNFLLDVDFLKYAHILKNRGPHNQLNAVLLFDEAKGLFGKVNQDKFLIKDLVSKVREWGLGLFCSDQIPSEISQFFFSNVGTIIMFRLSDGNDLQKLRYSMGATADQILENYSLKPGEALVRTRKCKDIIKIKIPFNKVEKYISREERERLNKPFLDEMSVHVIPSERNKSNSNQILERVDERIRLNDDERTLLECIAISFDKPSYQIYQEAELSQSIGYRLKEKLLKKKLISQISTNLGKEGKRALYLVPEPEILEEFGIKTGNGRGKPLHKHFQEEKKWEAEKFGFKSEIEKNFKGTKETPDVSLEKGELRIAVEICITSKPTTEVSNIHKNLELGFNYIILAFVSFRTLDKTKKLAIKKYDGEVLKKVDFCMVNSFYSVIRKF